MARKAGRRHEGWRDKRGRGLRGIYAAGILDCCMDSGICFDLGIGISAGSANLASFAAGQRGRNFQFYMEYAFRRQYMSLQNFVAKGSYVDLDYVYGTLSSSGGENPLDLRALLDNPMELYVIATDAQTGEAKYFDRSHIGPDNLDILKASCAIPLACGPYEVDCVPYFDGALGDPVPVETAFRLGCDCVVIILSRPEGERRNPERDERVAALIRKRYPRAADGLCRRAQRYNDGVSLAQRYAREGRTLILSPDDISGLGTLKKDRGALQRLYDRGYEDGAKIPDFLASSK